MLPDHERPVTITRTVAEWLELASAAQVGKLHGYFLEPRLNEATAAIREACGYPDHGTEGDG